MSVNARTTVSTSPASMRWRSPSMVRWRSLRVLTGSPSVRAGVLAWGGVGVSSEQAAEQRGGVVAVVLHHLAGAVGATLDDGPADLAVLAVRVADVGLERRNRAEHRVEGGLDRCHRLLQSRRPAQRGDREVEAGVGLPVSALARRVVD